MNIFVTESIPLGFHVYFLGENFLEVELLCQRVKCANSEVFDTYCQVFILPDKSDKFLFYSVFFSPSVFSVLKKKLLPINSGKNL